MSLLQESTRYHDGFVGVKMKKAVAVMLDVDNQLTNLAAEGIRVRSGEIWARRFQEHEELLRFRDVLVRHRIQQFLRRAGTGLGRIVFEPIIRFVVTGVSIYHKRYVFKIYRLGIRLTPVFCSTAGEC